MPKRSWTDANPHSPSSSTSPYLAQYPHTVSPAQSHESERYPIAPKNVRTTDGPPPRQNGGARNGSVNNQAGEERRMPTISRKVKACAACRKQKIKCMMPGEPPCQRCKERGLSCRLNKSLQTLMSEDSRWKSSVTKDLTNMYSSLEKVLQSLALPSLPTPHTVAQEAAIFFDQEDNNNDQDEDEQSYDNSPKVSPLNENLSHVPIESLYQITGLRALRTHEPGPEEQERICKQLRDTDFISRGLVSVEDAEYLIMFYMTRLDPYIWNLTGGYSDLESFRRRSPTLTACILTVAALHDTTRPNLYSICFKEFCRLVANAMFERHIDMEYLRAVVIGCYWLPDTAYTLSGYAIRRASEFHLSRFYTQIVEATRDHAKYTPEQLQKAMDGSRMLYLLYICDHHLSILYGRSPIMRDDEKYIVGWESFLASQLATDSDKRLASQVSLNIIMNKIRECFGHEDSTCALPASSVSKISSFEHELEAWRSRHAYHNPNKYVGDWPTKGVNIHYHFAKLYLESHVFRGLPESNPVIPHYFLETATTAVAGATHIVDLLLEDETLHKALAGVPHYFHGMIAFACMFLLRVATKHSAQLFADKSNLATSIARLAQLFKVIQVGNEHLVHRMAEGLVKMAEILGKHSVKHDPTEPNTTPNRPQGPSLHNAPASAQDMYAQSSGLDVDPFDPNSFGFGDPNLGLGMPFFDFEGTNLGLEGPYIQ